MATTPTVGNTAEIQAELELLRAIYVAARASASDGDFYKWYRNLGAKISMYELWKKQHEKQPGG